MWIVQFFENDAGAPSMTRLLTFLSFWPASYVVVRNYNSIHVADLLAVYLGAYVLGYVGGKGAEILAKNKEPK